MLGELRNSLANRWMCSVLLFSSSWEGHKRAFLYVSQEIYRTAMSGSENNLVMCNKCITGRSQVCGLLSCLSAIKSNSYSNVRSAQAPVKAQMLRTKVFPLWKEVDKSYSPWKCLSVHHVLWWAILKSPEIPEGHAMGWLALDFYRAGSLILEVLHFR